MFYFDNHTKQACAESSKRVDDSMDLSVLSNAISSFQLQLLLAFSSQCKAFEPFSKLKAFAWNFVRMQFILSAICFTSFVW